MWRGLTKAALLTAFGRVPGGSRLYRTVTRDWMATQSSHITKLGRVWPGYVKVWRGAGLELEGADVWIHEGGWTPFVFLANHLVTGRGGVVTNREATMLDRYVGAAVNAAVSCELDDVPGVPDRRDALERLRWSSRVCDVVGSVRGRLLEHVDVGSLSLPDASVDLCHTGGALEHLRPAQLRAFLSECRRIVRPGGLMSHVLDHRDHLHHADPAWPYLSHLRWSPTAYEVLFGHPLLYHNRLLPSKVAPMFEEEGFEPVALRRLVLPSHEWVDDEREANAAAPGIARRRLAFAFRHASEADLRTAAAHYVYRRSVEPA